MGVGRWGKDWEEGRGGNCGRDVNSNTINTTIINHSKINLDCGAVELREEQNQWENLGYTKSSVCLWYSK